MMRACMTHEGRRRFRFLGARTPWGGPGMRERPREKLEAVAPRSLADGPLSSGGGGDNASDERICSGAQRVDESLGLGVSGERPLRDTRLVQPFGSPEGWTLEA